MSLLGQIICFIKLPHVDVYLARAQMVFGMGKQQKDEVGHYKNTYTYTHARISIHIPDS